jgi:hypothetical protein
MLTTTVDRGFLSGFFVGSRLSEVVNISHWLFAGGTLVFFRANLDHLRYCVLFLCFEVVSDLKVNLSKSVLVKCVVWIMWMDWLTSWVVGFSLCP